MSSSGLVVRRTERFEISLPARVRVAPHHSEMVNFAKGVADNDGWIGIDVTDFGLGGVGFITDIMLPRMLVLELEIFDLGDQSSIMINCNIQVKRIRMVDRRPGYLIGGAFAELDALTQASVESLVDRLQGVDGDESQGGSHA